MTGGRPFIRPLTHSLTEEVVSNWTLWNANILRLGSDCHNFNCHPSLTLTHSCSPIIIIITICYANYQLETPQEGTQRSGNRISLIVNHSTRRSSLGRKKPRQPDFKQQNESFSFQYQYSQPILPNGNDSNNLKGEWMNVVNYPFKYIHLLTRTQSLIRMPLFKYLSRAEGHACHPSDRTLQTTCPTESNTRPTTATVANQLTIHPGSICQYVLGCGVLGGGWEAMTVRVGNNKGGREGHAHKNRTA